MEKSLAATRLSRSFVLKIRFPFCGASVTQLKELVWLTIVPPFIAGWLLFTLSPVGIDAKPRYGAGLATCVILSACGSLFPLAYTGVFLGPILCFSIAVSVALSVGKHAFFVGIAGCPWFLVPGIICTRSTYSIDQINAYGMPPFDRFTCVTLVFGLAGALFVQTLFVVQNKTNNPMDRSGGPAAS